MRSANKIKFTSDMKVKLCKECHGLGHVLDAQANWHRCGECFGYGRVVVQKSEDTFMLSDFDFDSNQLQLPGMKTGASEEDEG